MPQNFALGDRMTQTHVSRSTDKVAMSVGRAHGEPVARLVQGFQGGEAVTFAIDLKPGSGANRRQLLGRMPDAVIGGLSARAV